jgi:hypothetical protein
MATVRSAVVMGRVGWEKARNMSPRHCKELGMKEFHRLDTEHDSECAQRQDCDRALDDIQEDALMRCSGCGPDDHLVSPLGAPPSLRLRGRRSFHRASAAFFPRALRSSAVSASILARPPFFPPFRPRATAFGSFLWSPLAPILHIVSCQIVLAYYQSGLV